MSSINGLLSALTGTAVLFSSGPAPASGLQPILLEQPDRTGGMPLMAALQARASNREFSGKKLPAKTLSSLFWAAFGVNRPDSGKRTAPSARNMKEIDIYAALPEGLFLYDPPTHTLRPVLKEDIRALTGKQDFTRQAPVNLIFVAHRGRMGSADDAAKDFYSAVDTGFICQNVYLFCASEGLFTVVLGMVDKPALEKKMGLSADQKVILTQPVGYPKSPAGVEEKKE